VIKIKTKNKIVKVINNVAIIGASMFWFVLYPYLKFMLWLCDDLENYWEFQNINNYFDNLVMLWEGEE